MECTTRGFYEAETTFVARKLLGKVLVRRLDVSGRPKILAGIITETEAYGSYEDPASHAFRGPTKRNSTMFGTRGFCYVYLIYGIYHCVNVVAYSDEAIAGAVLIRSIFPVNGIAIMKVNREASKFTDLTNGPGKVCTALGINRSFNGMDMTFDRSSLRIEEGISPVKIEASKRVGITAGSELYHRYMLFDDLSCLHSGKLMRFSL